MEENPIRFECSRAENNVGSFACALPMRKEYDAITADYIVMVQHSFDAGAHWINVDRTLWFARDFAIETTDGVERLSIAGHDTLGLLERRIVAWFAVKNQDLEQNYYSIKYGPATDIIRQIVRDNFTAAATTAAADDYPSSVTQIGATQRVAPWLAVEGNDGSGGLVKAEFAWQSVLQAIGGVVSAAKGEHDQRILFDVRYTGAPVTPLRFICSLDRIGSDLSASVLVSVAAGNLDAPRMNLQYSKEVTWLHVGGKGEASLRSTLALTSTPLARSPFYPIEGFVDAGDTNDPAVMRQKGNIVLARATPHWTIAGNLIETPHFQYGRDFNYGDWVTVRYREQPFVCRVKSFRLRYENGALQVEVPLETDVDE